MDRDEIETKSDSKRTLALIREVGDMLVPGLKSTVDLPELYSSGKCPMLNLQVWIEETSRGSLIRHAFHQKPNTSSLVFHAGGAYSWQSTNITLVEEFRRCFLKIDGCHSVEERIEVARDFLQKMADSQYDHNTRKR